MATPTGHADGNLEVIKSDFAKIAGEASSISFDQLPAFLELQLGHAPDTGEIEIVSSVLKDGDLTLDAWLQWLEVGPESRLAASEAPFVKLKNRIDADKNQGSIQPHDEEANRSADDVQADELISPSSWSRLRRDLPQALNRVSLPRTEWCPEMLRVNAHKREGPFTIPCTEERGINVAQMRLVWKYLQAHCDSWLDWHGNQLGLLSSAINLYHVCDNLIRPITEEWKCSYVELVALQVQRPCWFLSHWWGEHVVMFLSCVEEHVKLHHLPESSPYWICAYANNQHNIGSEISSDPTQSSFFKAMEIAVGTLSIIDHKAVSLSRIWCCFEIGITLQHHSEKKFEMATAIEAGFAVVISDGPTTEDEVRGSEPEWQHRGGRYGHKAHRELQFPKQPVFIALKTEIQDGSASYPEDRIRILNTLARQADLLAIPPEQHPSFAEINIALHWRVGIAFFEAAQASCELEELSLDQLPEPAGWDIGPTYLEMETAFRAQSKYQAAQVMTQKALRLYVSSFGQQHVKVAECIAKLGMAYNGQGKQHLAIAQFKQALGLFVAECGETDLWVALCHQELADAYSWQRDTRSLALEHYHMALAIHTDDLEVARCYAGIADVCMRQGRLQESLDYQLKALDLRKMLLQPTHPDLASSYNGLANVYGEQGKHDTALEYYSQVLEIRLRALGDAHPDVAACRGNMGLEYSAQGKYDVALDIYNQVLACYLVVHGESHPRVANCYNNMAEAYGNLGRLEEAEHKLRKALEIDPDGLSDLSGVTLVGVLMKLCRCEDAKAIRQTLPTHSLEEYIDCIGEDPFLNQCYNIVSQMAASESPGCLSKTAI